MKKTLIYIVGTDSTKNKGGISSVLKAFEEAFNKLNQPFKKINTHNDNKNKLVHFFLAWLTLIYSSLKNLSSRRIYWLHCGPWFSMTRKYITSVSARILGGEVVIHFHSPTLLKYTQSKTGMLLIRCFLFPANKIVVVTPWWKKLLIDKGIKKDIAVIANPLSYKLLSFAEQTSPHKKPAFDSVNLVSMARLIDGKGLELIIETLAILPNMNLKIIGDGPLKSKLIEQAINLNVESRVEFLGWLNDEEKRNALLSGDLFCLPSVYDSFGVVFIEAMSLNLPIVAFNNGPVADIVKPHLGIAIAKYDAKHLKQAIEKVIQNIDSYNSNGKQEVLTNYNPTILAQEIITYLLK